MSLQLTVYWLLPLINVEAMHKKLLHEHVGDGFKKFNPRCVAFDTELKTFRSQDAEIIQSVSRFGTPFPVRKDIFAQYSMFLYPNPNDTDLMYVYLNSSKED